MHVYYIRIAHNTLLFGCCLPPMMLFCMWHMLCVRSLCYNGQPLNVTCLWYEEAGCQLPDSVHDFVHARLNTNSFLSDSMGIVTGFCIVILVLHHYFPAFSSSRLRYHRHEASHCNSQCDMHSKTVVLLLYVCVLYAMNLKNVFSYFWFKKWLTRPLLYVLPN